MNKATQAREDTIIAQEKEQISLAYNSLIFDKTTGKISKINKDNFGLELKSFEEKTDVEYIDNDETKDFLVQYTSTNHSYIVDKGSGDIKDNKDYTPSTPVILSSIKSWTSNANTDFHKESIRNTITEIEFVDYIPNPINLNENNCWDVSQEENQSIIAWIDDTKLYIGGDGGVKANVDSSYAFYKFSNLTNINFNNNYDTRDTTNMDWMFGQCVKLNILDLRDFDTYNVTSMSYMFSSWNSDLWSFMDTSIEKIIFGNKFNTSNVTNMMDMFSGLNNLIDLDLSEFNTTKVNTMYHMFYKCTKLKNIYVSTNFVTSSVTNSDAMFYLTSIQGGNGTIYNSSYVDKTYARIDKTGQPGYFIDKRQDFLVNNLEHEYLKFNGSQYIDTNIIPSNHMLEVKFDFENFGQDEHLFGTSLGNKYYYFTSYNNYYYWGWDGTGSGGGIDWENGIHTLIYNKSDNYDVILNEKKVGSGKNILSTASLLIGRRGTASTLNGKIYYLKLTDKSTGNLVRNFIPVHNEITNSAGLYDKVEGKFYPNNGTGAFTEGQKINN